MIAGLINYRINHLQNQPV